MSAVVEEALEDVLLKHGRLTGEVVVKVVVTPSTQESELDELAARMAAIAPSAPLVLQPVTPFAQVRERPAVDLLNVGVIVRFRQDPGAGAPLTGHAHAPIRTQSL